MCMFMANLLRCPGKVAISRELGARVSGFDLQGMQLLVSLYVTVILSCFSSLDGKHIESKTNAGATTEACDPSNMHVTRGPFRIIPSQNETKGHGSIALIE